MLPNIPGKLIAIGMFMGMMLFVAYYNFQQQDEIAEQNAIQQVTKFVDNVRTKGYITPVMIEDFKSQLEIGSYMFKVDMVHEKKVYIPTYTDDGVFQNDYTVASDNHYTDEIMDYLFNETDPVPKDKRKYYLTVEDYFMVDVQNLTRSKAQMMFDAFTNNNSDGIFISYPYGGMVLNEDY